MIGTQTDGGRFVGAVLDSQTVPQSSDYGGRMARILVVEDDPDLRQAMVSALASDGHRTDGAADGDGALEALTGDDFAVVLLDVGLGAGLDGIEVCRRLRAASAGPYVMMLTARDAEPDIVLALEAGADDYVVKPVGIVELRSRVRAALRRLATAGAAPDPGPDSEPLGFESLALDPSSRTVTVDGQAIGLTMSEFAVLEDLLRADGAIRSRGHLTETIYGDNAFRDPRNIDVHMHHLRGKIGAAGGDPDWIVTVRGAGYRMAR